MKFSLLMTGRRNMSDYKITGLVRMYYYFRDLNLEDLYPEIYYYLDKRKDDIQSAIYNMHLQKRKNVASKVFKNKKRISDYSIFTQYQIYLFFRDLNLEDLYPEVYYYFENNLETLLYKIKLYCINYYDNVIQYQPKKKNITISIDILNTKWN